MPDYGKHRTKIFLLNVPWDNTYSDTRLFDSIEAQRRYFNYHPTKHSFGDDANFRFLDGDGTNASKRDIKVPMAPEDAQAYNYLYYSNDDGETYHYMFITAVDYINYETSLLHLEEDLLQNYMFSYELLATRILRETTAAEDDDVSRLPDFLPCETDYIFNEKDLFNTIPANQPKYLPYICCFDAIIRDQQEAQFYHYNKGCKFGDKYLPFTFIVCDDWEDLMRIKNYHASEDEVSDVGLEFDIKNFVSYGYVSRAIVPQRCIFTTHFDPRVTHQLVPLGSNLTYPVYDDVLRDAVTSKDYEMPTRLDGVGIPDTHRMLCSPYCNVEVAHGGKILQYKPENLTIDYTFHFNFNYTFTDTFHCSVTVKEYDGQQLTDKCQEKIFEPVVGCCFPIDVDTYLRYIQENAGQLRTQRATDISTAVIGGLKIAVGIGLNATGAGTGGAGNIIGTSLITSGTSDIIGSGMSTINRENELATQQEQAAKEMVGNYGSDYFLCFHNIVPKVRIRQPWPEQANDIARYLQAFGYKSTRFGRPSLYNRVNWDYIQTDGCKIQPKKENNVVLPFMNNNAKLQIQSLYNKGIRFWHTDDVGDFHSYENPIRQRS